MAFLPFDRASPRALDTAALIGLVSAIVSGVLFVLWAGR